MKDCACMACVSRHLVKEPCARELQLIRRVLEAAAQACRDADFGRPTEQHACANVVMQLKPESFLEGGNV